MHIRLEVLDMANEVLYVIIRLIIRGLSFLLLEYSSISLVKDGFITAFGASSNLLSLITLQIFFSIIFPSLFSHSLLLSLPSLIYKLSLHGNFYASSFLYPQR